MSHIFIVKFYANSHFVFKNYRKNKITITFSSSQHEGAQQMTKILHYTSKNMHFFGPRCIVFCIYFRYKDIFYQKIHVHHRDGSRIFLGGGAPLRNGITDWWPDVNTSCIRKPQAISGGGGCAPLHPPPRSVPDSPLLTMISRFKIFLSKFGKQLWLFCCFRVCVFFHL